MTPMCEKTTDEKHTMTPCCSVGAVRVLGEMCQSNLFQDGNIHTLLYLFIYFLTQYQLQPSRQEHVDIWGLFWVFTGNFFHQHSRLVVNRCHFGFSRTTPSSQSFPKRRRSHIDSAAHRGESRGAFYVHLMDFYGLLAVVTCDLVAVTPIEVLLSLS